VTMLAHRTPRRDPLYETHACQHTGGRRAGLEQPNWMQAAVRNAGGSYLRLMRGIHNEFRSFVIQK
jgi:hypothetical protein